MPMTESNFLSKILSYTIYVNGLDSYSYICKDVG